MELSPILIRNTVYPAVQTMDHYLPATFMGIYNSCTPEEAVEAIEGEPETLGTTDNEQHSNE